MSTEGEPQRKPGTPDDTDGRRRLRAVSYPDPYLVTKLPLDATVNSGVIRLGDRMILGFIHRPYPDGTRVRVIYDEWLFAERVEDESEEGGGGTDSEARAATPSDADGAEDSEPPAKRGTGKRPRSRKKPGGTGTASKGRKKGEAAAEPPSRDETGSEGGATAASGTQPEPADRSGSGEGGGPVDSRGFPDDFTDGDRAAADGKGDAWTEAFRRGETDS